MDKKNNSPETDEGYQLSKHMHGRATSSPKRSQRGKFPRKRIRIDAEITPAQARAFEKIRTLLGCEKAELVRKAIDAFVGKEGLDAAVTELIAARENHELRRLLDLGFWVLDKMRHEPLLFPPNASLADHCRAVAASAAVMEIRDQLRTVLRLVAGSCKSIEIEDALSQSKTVGDLSSGRNAQ